MRNFFWRVYISYIYTKVDYTLDSGIVGRYFGEWINISSHTAYFPFEGLWNKM